MTIDEAITQFKYDAEQNRADYDISFAEDNEQVAEWLEELKAIKDGSIPIIHGNSELELHDREIRNKAIDDFVELLREKRDKRYMKVNCDDLELRKLAEQLKECSSDDVCEWKLEDEESNLYVTECEKRHFIFDGTPKENGYSFCPYCGKKIKVVE